MTNYLIDLITNIGTVTTIISFLLGILLLGLYLAYVLDENIQLKRGLKADLILFAICLTIATLIPSKETLEILFQ